jgi:hypothetical protein
LSVGGTPAITGFGQAIGESPAFTNRAGVPTLETNSQLMINRNANVVGNGYDLWIRHAGTVSGGTSASINGGLKVDYSVPATDGCSNWGVVAAMTTASTVAGAGIVGGYFQAWRTAGISTCTGLITDVADQSGNRSSLTGQLTSMEWDLSATDVDDAANSQRVGGVGVRQIAHVVFAQPSSTINSEYTMGLWFGTQTNGSAAAWCDSLLGVQGNTTPTRIRNFLDSRGAIAPSGVTDPVAAVRTSAGHIIDLNGGAALNSGPGNYLQYTTTGGNRLRYMVGATESWSVSDAGTVSMPRLQAYANDAAAATGGVPIGGLYRNGSVVQIRVT